MQPEPGFTCLAVVATLLCIVTSAGTAVADLPPSGRTYFSTVLGLANNADESYQIDIACVRFTKYQLCVSGVDCENWELSAWGEPGVKQGACVFEFSFGDDESGLPISMRGIARIDARGRRSTISCDAHAADALGTILNLGFAGWQVPPPPPIQTISRGVSASVRLLCATLLPPGSVQASRACSPSLTTGTISGNMPRRLARK